MLYNIIEKNSELVNKLSGVTIMLIMIVIVVALTASGYRLFLTIAGKEPFQNLSSKKLNFKYFAKY